jgi:hypothetical protein
LLAAGGNIVLAAILDSGIKQVDAAFIVAGFWKFGRNFLGSVQRDGYYAEGPGYYSYSFSEFPAW